MRACVRVVSSRILTSFLFPKFCEMMWAKHNTVLGNKINNYMHGMKGRNMQIRKNLRVDELLESLVLHLNDDELGSAGFRAAERTKLSSTTVDYSENPEKGAKHCITYIFQFGLDTMASTLLEPSKVEGEEPVIKLIIGIDSDHQALPEYGIWHLPVSSSRSLDTYLDTATDNEFTRVTRSHAPSLSFPIPFPFRVQNCFPGSWEMGNRERRCCARDGHHDGRRFYFLRVWMGSIRGSFVYPQTV